MNAPAHINCGGIPASLIRDGSELSIGRDTFPKWNRQLAESRWRGLAEDAATMRRNGEDTRGIEAQIAVLRQARMDAADQRPQGWLQVARERAERFNQIRNGE